MENWPGLKSEAKTLELYIDRRLHSSAGAQAPAASGAGTDLESGQPSDPHVVRLREIEESLGKFSDVVDKLVSAAAKSGSAANVAVAQRFRDVLADFRGEFRRQAAAYRQRQDAAALLAGAAGRRGEDSGDAAASDALLRERASLQGSTRAVDDILAQAAATGDMLRSQRASLASSAGRLGGMLTRIPGATQLMGAISARRSRNDTIVGLVIAACVCFCVWWVLLRQR